MNNVPSDYLFFRMYYGIPIDLTVYTYIILMLNETEYFHLY